MLLLAVRNCLSTHQPHLYGCPIGSTLPKRQPFEEYRSQTYESTGQRGSERNCLQSHESPPRFTYDDSNPIVGVWADCLSSTQDPGYTLELWNFGFAGIENAAQHSSLDPDRNGL